MRINHTKNILEDKMDELRNIFIISTKISENSSKLCWHFTFYWFSLRAVKRVCVCVIFLITDYQKMPKFLQEVDFVPKALLISRMFLFGELKALIQHTNTTVFSSILELSTDSWGKNIPNSICANISMPES